MEISVTQASNGFILSEQIVWARGRCWSGSPL